MVAVQKDLVFGAHFSFQKAFCGLHNEEIVKGIAKFPFYDLVVEQIQIACKIIPLAVMFDVGDIRYDLLHRLLCFEFSVDLRKIFKKYMSISGLIIPIGMANSDTSIYDLSTANISRSILIVEFFIGQPFPNKTF